MAILCKKYNLLFIMTPRTACTAVGAVLIDELGGEYLPKEDILNEHGDFLLQKKHGTVKQLLDNKVLTAEELSNLFVVATVRNHFDSMYSLYMKQKVKYKPLIEDGSSWVHKIPGYADAIRYCQEHSFDDWLYKSFGVPWYKRMIDFGHRTLFIEHTAGTDYLMKFENLQGDFNKVLAEIGCTRQLTIPRVNETGVKSHNSYKLAYSKKSKRLLNYVFRKELKKYGYKFAI